MDTGYLGHIVRTKGVLHLAERLVQIIVRFSFGRKRFLHMTAYLDDYPAHYGLRITFFVTAMFLKGRASLFGKLLQAGHELAAHGYGHSDMARSTKQEQIEMLTKAYRAFELAGTPVEGFRCPYLSYNADTLGALESTPFKWTSNHVVLWEKNVNSTRFDENYFRRLYNLYKFSYSHQFISLPRYSNRVLEIPVTAPDDEMLFERYHVRSRSQMSDVWLRILEKVYDRGELFNVLFHPERFFHVRESLEEMAVKARTLDPPIWSASLGELADWWARRGRSAWSWENVESGDWRAWLRAPEGASVLLKSEQGEATGSFVYKNYAQVEPISKRDDEIAFPAGHLRRYSIGISEECSAEMERFLVEEGFPVERSRERGRNSLYIKGYESFKEEDKLPLLEEIDRSPFPVLRLWRWPNGARSAMTISADVDSITLVDFVRRAVCF